MARALVERCFRAWLSGLIRLSGLFGRGFVVFEFYGHCGVLVRLRLGPLRASRQANRGEILVRSQFG